ncbi:L-fuculokinase [Celerinatantimonas sp. MCCC 1A17872]|uniref:L-fuculokinase n=1 Tax=Celerinatantimonas sp. MCCC 1A17872 TaxID=3177514 RepID=UPI0038C3FDF3
MDNEVIIVLDCGATNLRAIAVNASGRIVAKQTAANQTESDSQHSQWHIWSLENIMNQLNQCARALMPQLSDYQVVALTVTTFGVDGTLIDAKGNLLHPIISWKCPRTIEVMESIDKYIDAKRLQSISGVGSFSFNTIYKLIWLKENHPELIDKAHAWLFISSLINYRLTGVTSTDRTMAGTSQLLDIHQEQFSQEILDAIGLNADLFPPMVQASEPIGVLREKAARELGLKKPVPVISTGHDTQFALIGSGAQPNQPVLSSGTWEILMARTTAIDTQSLSNYPGSTCELDACSGLFTPGLQWLASGTLEWVRELFWPKEAKPDVYQQMIEAARQVPAGCEGLQMQGSLLNPASHPGWQGLALNTQRAHFYRAALEHLAQTLSDNLLTLEAIAHFKSEQILMVGGGTRNPLWNQLKANATGKTLKILDEPETTVLGAAMFAFAGIKRYDSIAQAQAGFEHHYHYIQPSH